MLSVASLVTWPCERSADESWTPSVGADQVLIKILARAPTATSSAPDRGEPSSALTCRDCRPMPMRRQAECGVAGLVESIGRCVSGIRKGDRVAALVWTRDSSHHVDYASVKAALVIPFSSPTTFDQAACVPRDYMTAVFSLYRNLAMPSLCEPATTAVPLLVYGASTRVGMFVVRLAKLSNIYPIIGVAGEGCNDAKLLGCDAVFDYRNGHVPAQVQNLLDNNCFDLHHAVDAVGSPESSECISAVLSRDGHAACFAPPIAPLRDGITFRQTNIREAFDGGEGQVLAEEYLEHLAAWLEMRDSPLTPSGNAATLRWQ